VRGWRVVPIGGSGEHATSPPRPPGPWPPPGPGPASCRASGGATSTGPRHGPGPRVLPGRVALTPGPVVRRGWARCRPPSGADTTGTLTALAEGAGRPGPGRDRARGRPARGLPGPVLAERALAAADFVAVVTGHPSETSRGADVVAARRRGPRTPGGGHQHRGPGQPAGPETGGARLRLPDWMIAAELAEALGRDSGRRASRPCGRSGPAPAYAGVGVAALEAAGATTGS